VTVLPLPVCFISGPDSICPLGSGQFFGPDSLNSYAWTILGAGTILGDTSVQMVEVQGNGVCDSSFTLNLIVTGTGGCSSTCNMTIYLVDTVPPVFTYVPDSLSLQCASTVPAASADSIIVTDNCAGNIAIVVSDSIMNDTTCPNQFTLIRTWTATDTCGNNSTATQVITVFDSIPPVLYGVPADTGVCCPDSIPPPANVTAIDSCDGAVAVTLTEVVSDSTGPNYFTLTRFWTAIDTCNNMVTDSMVIEVNDTLYPAGSGMVYISDQDDIILYFRVTPNPFNSSTNIQFSLKLDTYVSVDLYNYTGVLLRSVYNGNVTAGNNNSFSLTPDGSMQTGMYLLVLRTKYGIETRRIILKR
ncbi:MAG: T9SS type A sorting domain-containing protein, partial [Bacteroidetes bacterium]|nr:T9SS type A sorting domain-containing protein [Bacteroidota bacterium]